MNNKYTIHIDKNQQPDFKNYFLLEDEKSIEIFPNFNKINIFLGANNSGKSRFIRGLMKQNRLSGLNDILNLYEQVEIFNSNIKELKIKWEFYPTAISNRELENLLKENKFIQIDELVLSKASYFDLVLSDQESILDKYLKILNVIIGIGYQGINIHYFNINQDRLFLQKERVSKEAFDDKIYKTRKILEDIIGIVKNGKNFRNGDYYFIPTLRTAHSIFEKEGNYRKIKRDVFLDTISKNYQLDDYFFENSETLIIPFTGINLYYQIVNTRNGLKSERKKFEDFEKFIGKEFFNVPSVDIVAKFNINEKHENNDQNEIINIHIGDESRNLYELGDGVQALIILMYSIFMASENAIIFIDEPELNLHPGMQRLFLEQITSNTELTKKNLRYVVATHSNHFVDLTLEKDDISIYSFSKSEENKFIIKNVNAGDNELLRELGVNNSSVFLANCSIWVEGISDRNYIKAFLKAYCDADKKRQFPKEDIDFAFLEYAGSNLSHYEFSEEENENIKAFALNNRILILADNDSGKEEKHSNYKKLCELKPENLEYFSTDPYREIENLLTIEIWKIVLIEFCNKNKLKNVVNINTIQSSISEKLGNIIIDDFKKEYIGGFIKALNIEELNSIYEETNSSPRSLSSGYKTQLSKIVLDKVQKGEITWDLFSKNEKIVNLTESIYSFIKK